MTILVALKTENSVWVGADGRVSDDTQIIANNFEKWRATGRHWWAACGFARIYTLAEIHHASLIAAGDCLEFCEIMRALVDEDGWSRDEGKHGQPIDFDFGLLVTDGSVIIRYLGDGSYVRYCGVGDVAVMGSGADFTSGALFILSLSPPIMSDGPEKIRMALWQALTAACHFDSSCGGELQIAEIFS